MLHYLFTLPLNAYIEFTVVSSRSRDNAQTCITDTGALTEPLLNQAPDAVELATDANHDANLKAVWHAMDTSVVQTAWTLLILLAGAERYCVAQAWRIINWSIFPPNGGWYLTVILYAIDPFIM